MPRSSAATLKLSEKTTRLLEEFKNYSKITGIPLDELIEEAWSEYLECTIETRLEELAEQAASA